MTYTIETRPRGAAIGSFQTGQSPDIPTEEDRVEYQGVRQSIGGHEGGSSQREALLILLWSAFLVALHHFVDDLLISVLVSFLSHDTRSTPP